MGFVILRWNIAHDTAMLRLPLQCCGGLRWRIFQSRPNQHWNGGRNIALLWAKFHNKIANPIYFSRGRTPFSPFDYVFGIETSFFEWVKQHARYANIKTCRRIDMQTCRLAGSQVGKHADMQRRQHLDLLTGSHLKKTHKSKDTGITKMRNTRFASFDMWCLKRNGRVQQQWALFSHSDVARIQRWLGVSEVRFVWLS